MGVFSKVKDAKVIPDAEYLEPGDFVVLINRCKHDQNRKKRDFFAVETSVIESSVETAKPGNDRTWMVMLDQDAAMSDIVKFAMATTGCEQHEVDEAGVEELVASRQPLAGQLMRIHAWNKDTQKGNPFTRVKWTALSAAEEEKYGAIARQLGLLKSEEKAAAGGKRK
jgi:hypothetical protein